MSDAPTDAALLEEIANDPATAHVRPGPLSEEAVGELVAKRLGAEPDDAFRQACHRTTGGNPLLIRQLLRALETEGVRPVGLVGRKLGANGGRAIQAFFKLVGEEASAAKADPELGALASGLEPGERGEDLGFDRDRSLDELTADVRGWSDDVAERLVTIGAAADARGLSLSTAPGRAAAPGARRQAVRRRSGTLRDRRARLRPWDPGQVAAGVDPRHRHPGRRPLPGRALDPDRLRLLGR